MRLRSPALTRAVPAAAYMATIVAANVLTDRYGLVPIGLGLMVTAGTFAAGLSLIARDWVQETSPPWAVPALIVAGAALSAVLASPQLAGASGIAFLASELVDWTVFTPLRGNLPLAVVTSSIVAAPVDTVLFLALAGFPLTWQAIAGQLIVKTGLALAVAVVLARRR